MSENYGLFRRSICHEEILIVSPYSFPEKIEPKLAVVRAYWESLKRAGNEMPFWDDVTTTALPDLAGNLLLFDVFERPERYRFSYVGCEFMDWYGVQISNDFADEVELRNPFEYLISQCSATVEGCLPTYYRNIVAARPKNLASKSYARILLPLWGEGHIRMLLGAVVGVESSMPTNSDRAA